MNREPIGLYIFRFFTGFALLCFMCLLYWSSTLIEEKLIKQEVEIAQIKNELFAIRNSTEKMRSDILHTLSNAQIHTSLNSSNSNISPSSMHHVGIDKYPSILHEDPFYSDILPKLVGDGFVPHGTRKSGVFFFPDNLHPFSNWAETNNWLQMCNVTLAQQQFGKYETMAPDMALKIEERINENTGEVEFWVFLRDNVFWQPLKQSFFSNLTLAPEFLQKNQVTSEDFKLSFDAIMNPFVQEAKALAMRTYYDDMKEIEVIDKLTFVVRWKSHMIKDADGIETPKIKYIAKQLTGSLSPLPAFVFKYFSNGKKIVDDDSAVDTYRTNSVWAQNFAIHWAKNVIVSCGAWVFDGMNERLIKFKRNPDFYIPLAALTDTIEVYFKDSPDNIWQAFKNGSLDTCALQPGQLIEFHSFLESSAYKDQIAKYSAIKEIDYVARMYSYIGWNEATPYFHTAKVRRAMTMAIDRNRIIEQNLNGLGVEITGPFYPYSPSYDQSIRPLPFSPQQAKRLLEEEGWYDIDGDGIIDKKIGDKIVPFSFTLTYYVKNPTTKSTCEYISKALKDIGVDCRLKGVDIADLSSTFENKSFDALHLGWGYGTPPEDPRQVWSSEGAKEKGSSNAIGFANAEVDAIIEKLNYETDQEKRTALYHRFDAIIHDEQPYTFLYTAKASLLYRDYLQNVFIPAARQDLIPGADVGEPDSSIFWIKD